MRTRSALLVASCVLAASVVTGGALNESVGADKGIPPNHPQLPKFSLFIKTRAAAASKPTTAGRNPLNTASTAGCF